MIDSGTKEVVVKEEWVGRRLDAITKMAFELSWNKARDWISRGKIFVDGERVTVGILEPPLGAKIKLVVEATLPPKGAQVHKDQIMYLDKHIIVVDKPPDLLSVPFEDDDRGTLVQKLRLLLPRRPKKASGRHRNHIPGLHVVHRLDKATSGVMVFALSAKARDGLSEQFKDHSISRQYYALAHGKVPEGTYSTHMLTDRGDGMRGSRENAPSYRVRGLIHSGKLAITHVKVRESLEGATLVSCNLETGRTNQIRIHLSEDNHPIVGESVYMRDFEGDKIHSGRLMLHAATLGFIHPITEEEVFFESPMPADMAAMVEKLRTKTQA